MKKQLIAGAAVLLAIGAGASWYFLGADDSEDALKLYGNVDIRQVSLAFENSERIVALHAEEGDKVRAGQVLAELDTRTLRLRIETARARIGVQEQVLLRLRNGTRPQEVDQSRARLQAAQAEAELARLELVRLQRIAGGTDGKGVSRQSLDAAAARLKVARAEVENQRKAWQLADIGPRDEDIAQAQAELEVARADLRLLEYYLSQAQLKAPRDATVRTRLLEPGDMASPSRPVFALALTDPKWVRAYVNERQLGRVHPGQKARVVTDSVPERPVDGRVGYISSVAEFTPKTVETEDLRTSLVYEIRVLLDDPEDRLRLGMPATVYLDEPGAGVGSDGDGGPGRGVWTGQALRHPRRHPASRARRGQPADSGGAAQRPGRAGRCRQDHPAATDRRADEGRWRATEGTRAGRWRRTPSRAGPDQLHAAEVPDSTRT